MWVVSLVQKRHSCSQLVMSGCVIKIKAYGKRDCHMAAEIWVNIGSGNGLLPDGTKPLPEPMLTNHQ